MDQNQVLLIAKKFSDEIKDFITPLSVYLFGSYARGNQHRDSDIDIAVIVDHVDQYYETLIRLYHAARLVSDDIEPHLLIEGRDPGGFLNTVRKSGIKVA